MYLQNYEKLTAAKTLFSELKKGEDSDIEKGRLNANDVGKMVGH